MEVNAALMNFIVPYNESIQNLAINLRKFVFETLPESNELIWDNYNAVSIAFSKTDKLKDAFCHIALYPEHVNFGFNRGAELDSKTVELHGAGKLIRHIKVHDITSFPKKEVTQLLVAAIDLSEQLNPDLKHSTIKNKSIVMSISKKKLRPS